MILESMSLALESLRSAYAVGTCTPHEIVDEILRRIERDRSRVRHVWLHVARAADLHEAVSRALAAAEAGALLPLLGIPFAVKDNIDVEGMPTTAACPEFAYVPSVSAEVVLRLVRAGALVVGKVNLDQMATGLVGVRSPYGTPVNPFSESMIPGGSSSGSAVAVAVGHVSFALGTDTAGSGRVPAGYNNVVGLKPSRGALSTRGVVPACRSLDCVSVFALTVEDACDVASAARSYDPDDPFSRRDAQAIAFQASLVGASLRLGVPRAEQLTFFGDDAAALHFKSAAARFQAAGATLLEVDFSPFFDAGKMLYGDACVVERLEASEPLLSRNPDAFIPVVRDILLEARRFSALDAYRAAARLHALSQAAGATFESVDALLVPTAPTIYRIDDVLARPRETNGHLGLYATFVNLLDLAALAVPSGFRSDGLPAGITLIGPRASEPTLIGAGSAYHRLVGGTLGALAHGWPQPSRASAASFAPSAIAVVGAHLQGQPLNAQLTSLGATLAWRGKTAPFYKLVALRGTVPPKPGLVRLRSGGVPIEMEVWAMTQAAFATFVAALPRPMCVGSVELEDGRFVSGFLFEPEALEGADDISRFGGWRAYLKSLSKP